VEVRGEADWTNLDMLEVPVLLGMLVDDTLDVLKRQDPSI